MKKENTLLLLFILAFFGVGIISLTKLAMYTNQGFNKASSVFSNVIDRMKEDNEKNNKEEIKQEREKRNDVMFYDGYLDLTQKQLVADYINFFNRSIKKHPNDLITQNISFIGKRPLIGDVFYYTVDNKIYRTNNYYNDYDALLITEDGNNYIFQSQKCKISHNTKKVDIIKTEGPGNKVDYFMLPKTSPNDFSYIPDCTMLKLLKAK